MIAVPGPRHEHGPRRDVADGVLLALDKGEPGEAYVLGGQITTMRELIETRGEGQPASKPPKRAMPTGLHEGADAGRARWSARSWASRPNLRELISSADGVTFWAKHDKAMAELGYSPRGLEPGCARPSRPRASSPRACRPSRTRRL